MTRLVTAAFVAALCTGVASAAPAKQGGIFRVATTGASVQIDPQVSYVTTGWWMEYATAAKLYNYPDKGGQAGGFLRPEVAASVAISRDGRTYTFTIRTGFRFSDGTAVTAKSFVYAIKRIKDPTLNSPATAFAENILSATVKAGKLVIRLNHSDPSVLTTLALPFFQATSTKLPLSQEVTSGYPSAGPYYFSHNEVNVLTSLRKNPYWQGARPRHLDGVDVHWGMNEQTAYQQTLANQLDEGPIPASEVAGVGARFGVNKTRFRVEPVGCVNYLTFDTTHGLLAHNSALRRAINWALDRREYAKLAGPYAATPWSGLLSPLTPRSGAQPYPPKGNIVKARELAAGHFGSGKIVLAYRSSGTTTGLSMATLLREDLIRLGFEPGNIVMKGYSGAQIYDHLGMGEYDIGTAIGWCSDYSGDDFLLPTGFQSAKYQQKLEQAKRLTGNARVRALAKLDLEIMRDAAPAAPLWAYNSRFFLSNRVDPRSLVYQPVYQDFSIPALSLK